MNDLISRQAVIEALRTCYDTETVTMTNGDEYINYEDAIGEIEQLPSAQPEHTSNNDCNGCKFVGCYDTGFPCANCIRKNKDYYTPERRTDEHDDIFE